MASKIFDTMLRDAKKAGVSNNHSPKSNRWMRERALQVGMQAVTPQKMISDRRPERLQYKVLLGHMYMFSYDPKTKDTLPFYDTFPMIFPFRKVPGGFYGINLHYLQPYYRAILMDGLMSGGMMTNENYDDTTRLRLSYNVLSAAAKYKYFAPCVKHYLDSHVKSRFVHIHPEEWQMALFLPTQRFVGATKEQVWKDSRGKW